MPTLLVRRSAYEAVGAAFDEGTTYFDYTMWLRLAFAFPVGYLPVRDAGYRFIDTQITMTAKGRGEMQVELFHYVDDLLASSPKLAPDERWLRRRRAGEHLSAALDHLEDGERGPARAHVAQALRTYPPVTVDPRTPLALGASSAGPVRG